MIAPVLVLASVLASAAWPPLSPPPQRVGGGENDAAVIVGLERYASLASVPGARQAVEDWYAYLTVTLGVPAESVTVLADQKATLERMRKYIGETSGRTKKGGRFWLVFVGHGAAAPKGHGVLVGFDAQQDADSLYARSLPQTEALSLAGRGAPSRVVAVFDACFSGRSADGAPLVPGLQPSIAIVPRSESSKALVFTAASSDEFAGPLPGLQRPGFSYLLLGALQGWADSDADGRVSGGEALAYVRSALRTTVKDRTQSPELSGDGTTPLVRTVGLKPPDLSAIVLRELTGAEPEIRVPRREVQRNSPLGAINLHAETLLDSALDAQESESASAAVKLAAWCKLAKLEERNAYLAQAKAACAAWTEHVRRIDALRASVDADLATVNGLIGLKHKSWEEKVGALDEFLRTYRAIAPDPRLTEGARTLATLLRAPLESQKPMAFFLLQRAELRLPPLTGVVGAAVDAKARATEGIRRLTREQNAALDGLDRRHSHLFREEGEDSDASREEARRYEVERKDLENGFEMRIRELELTERRARLDALALLEKYLQTPPAGMRSKLPELLFSYAELAYEDAANRHSLAWLEFEKASEVATPGSAPTEPAPDYSRTLAALQLLLEAHPSSRLRDDALYLAGYSYEKMGRYDEANRFYAQVAEGSRHRIEAQLRLGENLFERTDEASLRQAAVFYARATHDEAHPMFDKALYKLGWTCRRMGDRSCAILAFDRLTAFYAGRAGGGGDLEQEAKLGALVLRKLDEPLVAAAYEELLRKEPTADAAAQ